MDVCKKGVFSKLAKGEHSISCGRVDLGVFSESCKGIRGNGKSVGVYMKVRVFSG